MLKGVDVYSGDKVIDWGKVRSAGNDFAFIKASQGTTIHDARHEINIQGAQAAGLLVGSYHFFMPTSDAANQAKFFLSCVGDLTGQLIPIIDAEKRGGMTVEAYSASVQAWLDVVEETIGRKPGIYVNGDYAESQLTHTFGEYPLWLAAWNTLPPSGNVGGWTGWTWWQNDAYATVPGMPNINGVDTDRYDGTIAQLRTHVIGSVTPQTTPVRVVDHGTNAVIETLQMVPSGDHIADQGKLYVKR